MAVGEGLHVSRSVMEAGDVEGGMGGQPAPSRVRDCRVSLLGSVSIHIPSCGSVVDLAFIGVTAKISSCMYTNLSPRSERKT